MKRSDSIINLAKALAAAQGEFDAATKDHVAKVMSKKGEGSSYQYSYADLASVLDVIRAPLSKNGLSFIQLPTVIDGRASVSITTTLFHESGEFIESDPLVLPVSSDMTGAQAIGSAITFGRRYSISSMLAIATEADDDGNGASGQTAETAKKEPDPNAPKCQQCGKVMKQRSGKTGPFWGCTGYPECKGTRPIEATGADPQAANDQKRQATSGEDSQVPPNDPVPPPKEKPNKVYEALRTRLAAIGCTTIDQASAVVRFVTGSDNGVYEWPTIESVKADSGAPAHIIRKIVECGEAGMSDETILHDACEHAGLLNTTAA